MPKKSSERLDTAVDSLRPYVERALKDEDFREYVREALTTARGIYGDLAKERGLGNSARRLATDKDLQDNLRRALEQLGDAADRAKGKSAKKKSHKKLLVAGILVKVAGDDELAPLDVESPDAPPAAAAVATNGGETVES